MNPNAREIQFPQQVVTSAHAIRNGAFSIKAAAIFYDKIIVVDPNESLPSILGEDFDYLTDSGIIVQRTANLNDYPEGLNENILLATESNGMQHAFASSDDPSRDDLHAAYENGLVLLESELQGNKPENVATTFIPALTLTSGQYIAAYTKDDEHKRDLKFALRFAFDRIVTPDEETAWQDIQSFRSTNVKSAFNGFHRWMRQTYDSGDFTHFPNDFLAEQETFERELKLHTRKTKLVTLKSTMTFGDAIGTALAGQWTAAFSSLLKIGEIPLQMQVDLLESESKLQGQPLYYFHLTKDEFDKSTS